MLLIEWPHSIAFSRILMLLANVQVAEEHAQVPCSGYGQTEWRPVPWLFLQSLNHVIFQNAQTSLKASSETILFFLPGLEDEAQNRQSVSRQKEATLMGFETLSFHSISTSICPTATFFSARTASQYQIQSMLDTEGWSRPWQAALWFPSQSRTIINT